MAAALAAELGPPQAEMMAIEAKVVVAAGLGVSATSSTATAEAMVRLDGSV